MLFSSQFLITRGLLHEGVPRTSGFVSKLWEGSEQNVSQFSPPISLSTKEWEFGSLRADEVQCVEWWVSALRKWPEMELSTLPADDLVSLSLSFPFAKWGW